MANRMKKPPMRLIVSVVAVLLVAVAVPLASAFADGMNGMVGGGEKVVYDAHDSDDFVSTISPVGGSLLSSQAGSAVYQHYNNADVRMIEPQIVFTSSQLDEDMNEIIVSTTDPTVAASVVTRLSIMTAYSPDKWLDDGAESIDLTLSSSRDIAVQFYSSSYAEGSESTAKVQSAMTFLGVKDGAVTIVSVPVVCSFDNATHGYMVGSVGYANLTASAVNVTLTPAKKTDIIRASVALSGCERYAMALTLGNAGNEDTKSILDGDAIKFNVKVCGAQVNGYAISNIFVGILGFGLIVGAVFATPWVGRGTFDKDSRHRRGGRSAYQGARNKYSGYKSKRRSGSKRRRW